MHFPLMNIGCCSKRTSGIVTNVSRARILARVGMGHGELETTTDALNICTTQIEVFARMF
jgi:hypothetical protein